MTQDGIATSSVCCPRWLTVLRTIEGEHSLPFRLSGTTPSGNVPRLAHVWAAIDTGNKTGVCHDTKMKHSLPDVVTNASEMHIFSRTRTRPRIIRLRPCCCDNAGESIITDTSTIFVGGILRTLRSCNRWTSEWEVSSSISTVYYHKLYIYGTGIGSLGLRSGCLAPVLRVQYERTA